MVRDNAARHLGGRVRARVARRLCRTSRAGAGRRARVRGPPIEAPRLNPIEPKRVRGRRAVIGPDRKRTADRVRGRVSAHLGAKPTEPPKPPVG